MNEKSDPLLEPVVLPNWMYCYNAAMSDILVGLCAEYKKRRAEGSLDDLDLNAYIEEAFGRVGEFQSYFEKHADPFVALDGRPFSE